MLKIEERMINGELVMCKCYYSLRKYGYNITSVRPIRPRKGRSDKGKKRKPHANKYVKEITCN